MLIAKSKIMRRKKHFLRKFMKIIDKSIWFLLNVYNILILSNMKNIWTIVKNNENRHL